MTKILGQKSTNKYFGPKNQFLPHIRRDTSSDLNLHILEVLHAKFHTFSQFEGYDQNSALSGPTIYLVLQVDDEE